MSLVANLQLLQSRFTRLFVHDEQLTTQWPMFPPFMALSSYYIHGEKMVVMTFSRLILSGWSLIDESTIIWNQKIKTSSHQTCFINYWFVHVPERKLKMKSSIQIIWYLPHSIFQLYGSSKFMLTVQSSYICKSNKFHSNERARRLTSHQIMSFKIN